MQNAMIDSARHKFCRERRAHWDRVSRKKERPKYFSAFYHQLLEHYYGFYISPGLKVLEFGCAHGNLLAAVKPGLGVGVDFSGEMIRKARENHPELIFVRGDSHQIAFKEKFDVIILSDLVNDIWDAQALLENLRTLTHPGTRLVMNFYNNLWRLPLALARLLNLGADVLEQNWFSPRDMENLLALSGFEVIHRRPIILTPAPIPLLTDLTNRYLANLPPFSWFCLSNIMIARPVAVADRDIPEKNPTVSVIVAARNEAGNIDSILNRVPTLGGGTELVFVEGGSEDKTYETIEQMIQRYPDKNCKLYRQVGEGKGDAVRLGFEKAKGDILMILDADLTVPPEDLPRFFKAIASGKGEFINGVRLVYPLEDEAMRFFNILGNKFFSLAFSWLLGQPIKDTLCGTKVLWKSDYVQVAKNRAYFGDFDPFGDFDLLFGAAKLNLKISEIPIRYRSRTYGTTNISRWRHGWLLLKMVVFAARRLKFI
jgi:2-polyprenyl-3-methyl-5-hydroxy-6-metoxy-1,4-benzoquinol methylase